jgi:hypothetical protein
METHLALTMRPCCELPSLVCTAIGTNFANGSRFLRARKFNLKLAKKMIIDCVEWRHTVEGVGIDELYDRIDPWDVSLFTQLIAKHKA